MKRNKKGHAPAVKRQWLAILILLVVGATAYWNSFGAPFVFDDFATIETNSQVQFGAALTPSRLLSRSILYLTFAVNHAVNGENVWGYHLVNLLLHLLNGALIYLFGRRLFARLAADRADLFALLASSFFLAHPVQTESVTYISSRSELLSTTFYLVALFLFARKSPERIGFVFSVIIGFIFLIGLGVKETVISLPAALLLYDFIFVSGGQIRKVLARWRFYATFLIGGPAIALYLMQILGASVGSAAPGNLGSYDYFLTQLRVILRYVQVIFFPLGLNLAYDFPPSVSIINLRVILSGLFLAGLVLLAWWFRKRQPVYAFSIFWFFITLAPTSSVVPISDVIAEHRLYLPMVGVCLSVPFLVEIIQQLIRSRTSFRITTAQLSAVLIVVLATMTVMRNEVWGSDIQLWSDVVAKSPRIARGYSGLAQAYYTHGDYDKAVQISREGLKNTNENAIGFYGNIGQFCLASGRYDDALEAFSKALEQTATSHDRARGFYNIAVTYISKANSLRVDGSNSAPETVSRKKGQLLLQAKENLVNSLQFDGDYLPALDSYVNVVIDRGEKESLHRELQGQLQKKPGPTVYYSLGKLAFQTGDFNEAVHYFEMVGSHYDGEKMFWFNYAYALEESGNPERAKQKYLEALNLDPLFLQAHHNLAQLYLASGQYPAAIEHFQRVLKIDPQNMLAHLQLARIYIKQGQRNLAREHLSAILSVSPGNQEAAVLWNQTL